MNPYIYLLNGAPYFYLPSGTGTFYDLNVLHNLTVGNTGVFGGNLTVSGTGTSSIGTTTGFSYSTVPTAGFSVGAIGTGGSFMVQTPSLSAGYGSGFAVDGTYTSGKSVINLKAFGVSSGGPYSADLAFFTSATTTLAEQMRLNSAGNLLLGTTTDAGQKLQVNGTAYLFGYGGSVALRLSRDVSNVLDFYQGGGYSYIDSSTGQLRLSTGGTTALALDSSQNASFTSTITASNTILSNKSLWSSGYTTAPADSTQRAILGVSGGTVYLQSLTGTVNSPLSIDGSSVSIRTGSYVTALTIDSSQRTILSGALRLNNAYTVGAVVSTGYVTIQDSTGTTYKVAVSL